MFGRLGGTGDDRPGNWRSPKGVYGGIIVLLGTLAIWGSLSVFQLAIEQAEPFIRADAAQRAPSTPLPARTDVSGHATLTQDDWIERIRSKDFWGGKRTSGSGPSAPAGINGEPSRLQGPPRPAIGNRNEPNRSESNLSAADFHDGDDSTYRTMCVRLCDGYYWPVSFATTDDHFKRDRNACEKSCGSPARLFVYKNPGNEPEDMRDPDGQPYTKLKTAFLFRTKYDASCKCTPHPWEQEAQDRHRVYALEAARRKGDKSAGQELAALKTKIEAEKRVQGGAKRAGPPAVVSSATIVAGSPAETIEPDRSTERLASPVIAVPPPAAARPTPQRSASRSALSPTAMRLGATSDSRPTRGSASISSTKSRGTSGWKANAFRAN